MADYVKSNQHPVFSDSCMKIIQIVGFIGDKASGPAYTVPSLCNSLADHGLQVQLHVNENDQPENMKYSIHVHKRRKWPSKLYYSPALLKALKIAAQTSNIMHSHGLWAMPYIYPGRAVNNSKCWLIISPEGSLSEWALKRSYWKKAVSWHIAGQKQTLYAADMLHATSLKEFNEIRRFGLKQPVAIIPNGINIPALSGNHGKKNIKRLFFLGRIHPVKGVDNLLQAWSRIENDFSDWELIIVGPDSVGYLDRLKRLTALLKIKRVRFKGELYGAEKQNEFLQSDLFILPSYTENFGMVAAEALAYGIPVIATKGTPWQDLEKHKCGWWIDINAEAMAHSLSEAMSKSRDQLKEMGLRGREWMEREFSWNKIGYMMKGAYEWIERGGKPPIWIRLD